MTRNAVIIALVFAGCVGFWWAVPPSFRPYAMALTFWIDAVVYALLTKPPRRML